MNTLMIAGLPSTGVSHEEILRQLRQFRDADCNWKNGHALGYAYYHDDVHADLLVGAYALYANTNPLRCVLRSLLFEVFL